MKFFYIDNIPNIAYSKNQVILTIDFHDRDVISYIIKLQLEHRGEIIRNLNMINNQGITDITFGIGTYSIGDLKLAYTDLCTAERVFLMATAAEILKRPIYLCNDLTQLTETTFKKFFQLFYNSEHVNIVYTNENEPHMYERLLREIGYITDTN